MSNPKAFDPSGVQFAWDSTSIKLAEECLRKYQYKMLEGWQPEVLSTHLRFGQHYATALEHYHKLMSEGMDREEAIVSVVWEAIRDTWDRPTCKVCGGRGEVSITAEEAAKAIGGFTASAVDFASTTCLNCEGHGVMMAEGAPWVSDHNTKTRENLIRTIVWYLDQFENDPVSTLILVDGTPAVEHSFTLPVDDGIIFTGHLDRLGLYSSAVYVQDQKTTGTTITPRYFEGFNPDTQMSMYTFAGKVIFNIPVKGVIIDAAQIAVGFSRFERGFTFRDEKQLNEWYDNTLYHIQVAQRATQENYFPMNRSSCGNYGGCEFRDICSRTPSVREQFLKGKFVKGKRWDPLERR